MSPRPLESMTVDVIVVVVVVTIIITLVTVIRGLPFLLIFGRRHMVAFLLILVVVVVAISDAEGLEVLLEETINVGQSGGVTGFLVNVVVVESGLAAAPSVLEGEGELLGMLIAVNHPLLRG